MEPDREAPTWEELVSFAATLPSPARERLLAKARPLPTVPEAAEMEEPPPRYQSWTDFLSFTTPAERQAWCRLKAKTANRPRLMSGTPDEKVTPETVWEVCEAALGRCTHCDSLAVEGRPSGVDGRPAVWAHVGRRIGSLGHRVARFNGGTNDRDNLSWSCLWCNTWPSERRQGASDHGAVLPP